MLKAQRCSPSAEQARDRTQSGSTALEQLISVGRSNLDPDGDKNSRSIAVRPLRPLLQPVVSLRWCNSGAVNDSGHRIILASWDQQPTTRRDITVADDRLAVLEAERLFGETVRSILWLPAGPPVLRRSVRHPGEVRPVEVDDPQITALHWAIERWRPPGPRRSRPPLRVRADRPREPQGGSCTAPASVAARPQAQAERHRGILHPVVARNGYPGRRSGGHPSAACGWSPEHRANPDRSATRGSTAHTAIFPSAPPFL